MLLPLLAIGKPAKGDLLDVGCGFSFVPHYWTTMGHGDAVGLESSRYGTIGSEILGTRVIAKYYGAADEIRDRRFDYVFSSEVIEHVRDPHAFAAEIAQGLKPDGIMVLTTPSAAAASSKTDPATLGSALSPGFHYFLASKTALADVLRAAGFPHVKVIDNGIRLFAWASKNPLPEIDLHSFDRAAYYTYLWKLSETDDHHVRCGALYRLFKDYVLTNQLEDARTAYEKLRDATLAGYEIDLDHPTQYPKLGELAGHVWKSRPSWLGVAQYVRALYLSRAEKDDNRARMAIEAGIAAMQEECDRGLQFAGEPYHFLPRAKRLKTELLVRDLSDQLRTGKGDVNHPKTLKAIYALAASATFQTFRPNNFGPSIERFWLRLKRSIRKRMK